MRQHYFEQLVFSSELAEVLHSRTSVSAVDCLAAGELQHCLQLSPDSTLLGLGEQQLRVVNPVHGVKVWYSLKQFTQFINYKLCKLLMRL